MARAVAWAALVALVVLTGTPRPVGAIEQLGATLSPAPLVWERDPHHINLTNRGTMPLVVRLEVDGDGWALAASSIELALEERVSVEVLSAGEGDATIRAILSPRDAPATPDRLSVVLESIARHETLLERLFAPWMVPGAILVLLVALWAVLARRRRSERGQAIVEAAIVLPIILFTGLGFLEAGMLIAAKADQDRATAVVADYAASRPGEDWHGVANELLPGCVVAVEETPDLFTATSTCAYRGRVTSGILDVDISSEESSASEPAP